MINKSLIIIPVIFLLVSCQTIPTPKSPEQIQYEKLAGQASRLHVRTGGMDKTIHNREITLLDSTNNTEIIRWIKLIELQHPPPNVIKDPKTGTTTYMFSNCCCYGEYTFEFFRAGSSILAFSLHHMSHIRSIQLNNGCDIKLTPESAKQLDRVLSKLLKNKKASQQAAGGDSLKPAPQQ